MLVDCKKRGRKRAYKLRRMGECGSADLGKVS